MTIVTTVWCNSGWQLIVMKIGVIGHDSTIRYDKPLSKPLPASNVRWHD